MDTSEKIASLRSAFGLSQEELAARVGVARQTVVSWEQGARPSAFNRRRIIEEFALPSNYFDADVSVELVPADKPPMAPAEEGALQLSVPVNTTEEELPLSKHAQRASDALRSLGTVMRWGNVFFAGIIALGALFSIVIVLIHVILKAELIHVILKAEAEAAGAVSIVVVNWDTVICINIVLWGLAAAFYGMCFFLRLLLREILRTRVRRKGGAIQQNKKSSGE